MTAAGLQGLSQIIVGRLLNTAAEGVVLAGMAWLWFRFSRRLNSGTRFAACFSVLLAIVALPFVLTPRFIGSHSALPSGLQRGITLPPAWAGYFFYIWAVIASLILFRLAVGVWRLRQLRQDFSEVDLAVLNPEIANIVRDFGDRRRVKLCVSNELAVPAAVGFFHPAIVLPAKLLPELSAEELKLILLHEFAHLRRWDNWTNLVQKIVKAVFFFHPAVWWIESRLALEREMACDDIVLEETAGPAAYATSLISFAEKLQNARSLALAQNLVSRMCHMSLRVTQILDKQRPRPTLLWKSVLGMSAGMFALVFAVAFYRPQFVAFENYPQIGQSQKIQPANWQIRFRASKLAKALPLRVATTGNTTYPVVDRQIRTGVTLARAVPASFPLRTAGFSSEKIPARRAKARLIQVRTTQPEIYPETIFILQTTRYDVSGARVWTLCIWSVGRNNSVARQLESAILASSI
jgi:Zn-dependent protease with chaperone function